MLQFAKAEEVAAAEDARRAVVAAEAKTADDACSEHASTLPLILINAEVQRETRAAAAQNCWLGSMTAGIKFSPDR